MHVHMNACFLLFFFLPFLPLSLSLSYLNYETYEFAAELRKGIGKRNGMEWSDRVGLSRCFNCLIVILID